MEDPNFDLKEYQAYLSNLFKQLLRNGLGRAFPDRIDPKTGTWVKPPSTEYLRSTYPAAYAKAEAELKKRFPFLASDSPGLPAEKEKDEPPASD